jgi:hypothetical protein
MLQVNFWVILIIGECPTQVNGPGDPENFPPRHHAKKKPAEAAGSS